MLHLLRDTQTHSCHLSTTQLVFLCFHPKDGTIVQSVILGKYLGRKGVYSFLIKLHVHLLQFLNTQYNVFPLFLFCFHRRYKIWESLLFMGISSNSWTLRPYWQLPHTLLLSKTVSRQASKCFKKTFLLSSRWGKFQIHFLLLTFLFCTMYTTFCILNCGFFYN
jgi:hypothetical protein